MTPLAKTMELIRKLLAKADSAAELGSAEEAAAFAGKANELLLQHKLEMSDIDLAAEDTEDPIENDYVTAAGFEKGGRSKWISTLFHHVAKAHFCRSLYVDGSKKVRLIGRKSDREIVTYLVSTLARNGERLAKAFAATAVPNDGPWSYRESPRTAKSRAKSSFLLGYVSAISERLRGMRAHAEQQGGQFAVVRFRRAENEVARIADVLTRGKTSRSSQTIFNSSAFAAGQEAGRSASLHGGVGGGNGGNGTIARGARLLGGGK